MADARQRLQRIRREDVLGDMERLAVIEAYLRREPVFLGKRYGLWDWNSDGIPLWLVPQLQDAGLLGG